MPFLKAYCVFFLCAVCVFKRVGIAYTKSRSYAAKLCEEEYVLRPPQKHAPARPQRSLIKSSPKVQELVFSYTLLIIWCCLKPAENKYLKFMCTCCGTTFTTLCLLPFLVMCCRKHGSGGFEICCARSGWEYLSIDNGPEGSPF